MTSPHSKAPTPPIAATATAVLVVGVRARDLELLSAWFAAERARGTHVRVLTLTEDPATPTAGDADVQLAQRVGASDAHGARLEPGRVGAHTDLVALVRGALPDAERVTIAAPSPLSRDLDARAAARAAMSALASRDPRSAVLVSYGDDLPESGRVDVHGVACVRVSGAELPAFTAAIVPEVRRRLGERDDAPLPRATAVVSTWNKRDDVRANLESLHAQTLPFERIVVVDNASKDGTAEMVAREFPLVELIVMPHDRLGACETFNIGFKASRTELTAILDDDIVMPPDWLEKATLRIVREPATTAILSTQVVEPGTPEAYLQSKAVNEERYMSTFRGCASLARTHALREAGYYDERLFIYGNERDLTCRLLNLGYRVLQYPGCGVFHRTPFGIKMGKRSLYYHARNAWISMLKYAPLSDLVRMPWLVVSKVVLRSEKKEAEGGVRDAVGTIGIGRSLRETKGAWWVVTKAGFSVLYNVPYCLKHRRPVKAPDFELPLH